MERVRQKGAEYLAYARENSLPAVILAGRPYHIDAEINHGIDQLINDLGAVVLSEDSISAAVGKFPTGVLNQWTYHARMYAAAKFVAESPDAGLSLVQLVSFGCGVDAVTTDEVRAIIERSGKIYTQVKIDEITNLGAVKIRIRSLFAAGAQTPLVSRI
jgi:predicted nucleotide-binding protein (sugar kinase/HSP70/actin superfamily)